MSSNRERDSTEESFVIHAVLLGGAAAFASDVPIHCPSRKGFALFAYLALDRRPHSRRALAALLWEERDPLAARASLRATLSRLPSSLASCLAIERDSVALAVPLTLTTDVGRFEALARSEDLELICEAARLYRGPLLHGFEADAAPAFDDWLHHERTRLEQLAFQLLDRGIGAHRAAAARGGHASTAAEEAARSLAHHWLSLDAASERAHRWLIRMHLDAGDADAARAQFESCQRALAVAQGRAPGVETCALLAAPIQPVTPAVPAHATLKRRATVPAMVATTSFVGRTSEVAAIAKLLTQPSCRLLTLHGLGGVGKTRLAHRVAEHVAEAFPDGAAWVSLEGVERPAAVADAMARALGIDVPPRTAAREALLERLERRGQLIVLDNFEHLLSRPGADAAADDPVELLIAVLRAAPAVRLLVTSRETLGVQEEWVLGVDGLGWRVPDDASADAATLPAVELFTQRARQADLRFSPDVDLASIVRICAQVEGLPLGLELAAASVRTLRCAEIVRELERGLDVPRSLQRNRPERQQTLRAVIDFSWRLLDEEAKNALGALSEFRGGGFTREAAEMVAHAPLRTLSALVDRALVRRSAEGRYSMHPLVRRYAAEQLARSEARRRSTRDRHADHYLRILREAREALYGEDWANATRELEKDLDNVRAAWAAKVASRESTAVRDGARPLCLIFDRLGLHDEWTSTFDEALTAYDQETGDGAQAARQALALSAAYGHWRRGDPAHARAYRAQVEEWIASASDAAERADLHKLCGLIDRDSGDFDAALRHFALGVQAAQRAGELIVQAQLANEIGVVHWRRGDLASARDAFQASLDKCNARGNVFDVPMSLHNVAFCDLELGRFQAAEDGFERALQMYRDRANARGEAMVLSSLGILARRRGDFARAETLSRAYLALAERTGSPGAVADALDDLAQVLERRGGLVEAEALYLRALAMSRELGLMHLQCMVLLHLARTQAATGDPVASARSLLDALALADEHDIHAGRMVGVLRAAGLRIVQEDAPAATIARRWCDSVLAVAGANVEVREAIPDALRTDDPPPPGDDGPEALRSAVREVLDFLRQLAHRR